MNKNHSLLVFVVCTAIFTGEMTYIGYQHKDDIQNKLISVQSAMIDGVAQVGGTAAGVVYMAGDAVHMRAAAIWQGAQDIRSSVSKNVSNAVASIHGAVDDQVTSMQAHIANIEMPRFQWPDISFPDFSLPEFSLPDITLPDISLPDISLPEITIPEVTLPNAKMVTFRQQHRDMKDDIVAEPIYLADFNQVEPAAGEEPDILERPRGNEIDVEAVLVPQKVTVISSSRDGRIKNVFVDNGDTFQKGDILIEYDCDDLNAEKDVVAAEKNMVEQKVAGTEKLFKLDLISDLEKLDTQTKAKQLDARIRMYDARMDQCRIYAGFDGRVTNRLANPNEYTRTDRVLMEIASSEPLRAEFLVPSIWLRWINVGAPLDLILNETEKTYQAKVTRIHGEVDPVSQSIQVVATMDPYNDPLLPGMSGQAHLNSQRIFDAGVRGFLHVSQSR